MGKGKGANITKVAPVKAGQILFSIRIQSEQNFQLLKSFMRKLSFKIPLRHTIIFNNW